MMDNPLNHIVSALVDVAFPIPPDDVDFHRPDCPPLLHWFSPVVYARSEEYHNA